jgi:hypothetical protein
LHLLSKIKIFSTKLIILWLKKSNNPFVEKPPMGGDEINHPSELAAPPVSKEVLRRIVGPVFAVVGL